MTSHRKERAMEIHDYYVTFGVQYSGSPNGTPHPLGMHKDGYAVIEAPDLEMARRIANAIFGDKYAFIYPKSEFIDDGTAAKWHHAGELLRICWKVPTFNTGGGVRTKAEIEQTLREKQEWMDEWEDSGASEVGVELGWLQALEWVLSEAPTGGVVPPYITDRIPGHEGDQP